MSRSVSSSIENNFVNGLVTEATGLNFPENAATDTLNCVFKDNGRVSRRKGFDLENNYSSVSFIYRDRIVSSFLWEAVGGNGDQTIYVQQIGTSLLFYNVRPNAPLSNGFMHTMDLPFTVGWLEAGKHPIQYASGNGDLIISHRYMDPILLRFNPDTNTVSLVKQIFIRTRDFEGADDTYTKDEKRPDKKEMNAAHWYNLANQGWATTRIEKFYKDLNVYPSNCDVWWLFKDETQAFDPKKMNTKVTRGNSAAPSGRYTKYAFNFTRSTTKGKAGSRTSGLERPSCVRFFAGRAWYAGTQARGYGNEIYFSQIIETDAQYSMCHQANDPTSEDTYSLLPSDGGVVKILEAGQVIRLWAVDTNLLVFCSNGIWAISGSTGVGFTANDYQVKKISSISSISPYSFIDVDGAPVWWNADGIYTLSANSTLGQIQVTSLVDKKIKKWYDSLPEMSKRYAKGAINPQDRTIQWLVQQTPVGTGIHDYFQYDTVLQFNLLTQAFNLWSLPKYDANTPVISDIVVVKGVGDTIDDEEITTNDGEITYRNDGQTIEFTTRTFQNFSAIYKYITKHSGDTVNKLYTFSDNTSTDWKDWTSFYGGVGKDYLSYFVTGFKIRGDAQRKFQTNYLWVYTENTNPSYCYVQNIWDYATDPNTGRWSTKQKLQSNVLLRSSFKKRFKLRGHGLVCQLRFESVPGEPFDIIGWSIFETSNASP